MGIRKIVYTGGVNAVCQKRQGVLHGDHTGGSREVCAVEYGEGCTRRRPGKLHRRTSRSKVYRIPTNHLQPMIRGDFSMRGSCRSGDEPSQYHSLGHNTPHAELSPQASRRWTLRDSIQLVKEYVSAQPISIRRLRFD